MSIFLAADIGGTKTEIGIFDGSATHFEPVVVKRYESARFDGVADIIDLFLDETGHTIPHYVGLGIAGPINDDVATVTNLPWVIDKTTLLKQFDLKGICMINDLTAVCASISALKSEDLFCLHSGTVQENGAIGVVAPGTGLGEGYLIENETTFLPTGCEGGHSDFAPVDELQVELLGWMLKKAKPVSYEDLIAGPGIPNLYDFFVECVGLNETARIKELLTTSDDRTPIIVENGVGEDCCPVCRNTVDLFLQIVGSEAGNMALKIFATGGVYLGGGILPRLIGKVSFDGLISAYLSKGKMRELVESMPLNLIRKNNAALVGVARYTLKSLLY